MTCDEAEIGRWREGDMVPRMVWVSRHSGKQSLFRHHRSGCVLRAFALFLRDDRSPGQALVGGE